MLFQYLIIFKMPYIFYMFYYRLLHLGCRGRSILPRLHPDHLWLYWPLPGLVIVLIMCRLCWSSSSSSLSLSWVTLEERQELEMQNNFPTVTGRRISHWLTLTGIKSKQPLWSKCQKSHHALILNPCFERFSLGVKSERLNANFTVEPFQNV